MRVSVIFIICDGAKMLSCFLTSIYFDVSIVFFFFKETMHFCTSPSIDTDVCTEIETENGE